MQEGTGDNDRPTHPRVNDYPPRPPFPQQIMWITIPNQKQQPPHVKHPRGLHQRPPLNEGFFVIGEQRDKHESNCIPKTHTRLSRRLMPGQIWGLQPQRIRMEISLTSKITGPRFQQPPRAHWERHLPVDRYNRWAIKRSELLFVHDRQHHIQRVDQKDKFQGRCGRHPSHNQDRSGTQPRLSFHDP